MMNYMLFSTVLSLFSLMPLSGGTYISWQADQAYRAGDLDKARALYEDAVSKSPQDMQALYNVGKVAYKQKDYVAAQKAFTQVGSMPQTAAALKEQALFNKGDSQLMQKNLDDALTTYDEVLALNPQNAHAQERIELIKKLKDQQKNEQKNPEQNKQDKDKEEQNKQDQEKKDSDKQGNDQKSDQNKEKQDKDESSQKNESQKDQKKEQSSQDQKEGSDKDTQQDKDKDSSEGDQKESPDKKPQGNDTHNKDSQRDNKAQDESKKRDKERQDDAKKSDDERKNEQKRKQDNADKGADNPADSGAGKQGKNEKDNAQSQEHAVPRVGEKGHEPEKSIPENQLNAQERAGLERVEEHDKKAYKQFFGRTYASGRPQPGQKNW